MDDRTTPIIDHHSSDPRPSWRDHWRAAWCESPLGMLSWYCLCLALVVPCLLTPLSCALGLMQGRSAYFWTGALVVSTAGAGLGASGALLDQRKDRAVGGLVMNVLFTLAVLYLSALGPDGH